jgi:RNA 2',3'-cyclic 3'-phosphodiesterase
MLTKKQKLRAFISIDFPNEIIKEIARIQSLIKNKPFTGKITELENLHLTLKFLGEINKSSLDKVKALLSKIVFPKFEASLKEAGTFSHHGIPKIVWIKVSGKIFDLQQEIDESLEKIFPKELRFMSHLTIARIKYVKDKKDFQNHVKNLSVKPIKFPITNFKLKSSELTPFGPKYKTIRTYRLI